MRQGLFLGLVMGTVIPGVAMMGLVLQSSGMGPFQWAILLLFHADLYLDRRFVLDRSRRFPAAGSGSGSAVAATVASVPCSATRFVPATRAPKRDRRADPQRESDPGH
jgi:hypothetical protein